MALMESIVFGSEMRRVPPGRRVLARVKWAGCLPGEQGVGWKLLHLAGLGGIPGNYGSGRRAPG